MGFKEDADFARFVSMGAVGTAAVATHLRATHGHQPIELERYAMANKVWQTKVKRMRLPDLVCVRCGRRVESRAKSKLGIILSHSDAPGRQWDAGGMRSNDLYAFLRADLSQFPPYAGAPFYFTTTALRATVDGATRSAPKAASEGSEVTLSWQCWVPRRTGTFTEVDAESRIVCAWEEGGTYRYWQWRDWPGPGPRFVYLAPGDVIDADESIVAGVVEPADSLDCDGDIWDITAALGAPDLTDRYAAIKAAGATARIDLAPQLIAIAEDVEQEHLDARYFVDQFEGEEGLLRIGAAADIEEAGRLAAVLLDHVHGGHGQTGAVAEDADVAVHLDQIQTVHLGAALALGHVAEMLLLPAVELLLAAQGIVVDRDLAVEGEQVVTVRDDERVDFG